MLLKIYVNESPIYITDKLTKVLKELSTQKDVLLFKEEITGKVAGIVSAIKKDKKKAVIIVGKNMPSLKQYFFEQFTKIEAAGGIVQNEERDLLFIYRRDKWDLPKGKMEKGETPEICAEREIEEETGIKNLLLKHAIGDTYHIYEEEGKNILKISHWFYFTTKSNQKIIPQTMEDISEVKWIHTRNIKAPMANTYQNIKDILTIFFDTP